MITQQIKHHEDYEIAHRFALNAMSEPNVSGVMSQLMRVLKTPRSTQLRED